MSPEPSIGPLAVLRDSIRSGALRFSWALFGLAAVRVWIQCLKYDGYSYTDASFTSVSINFVQVAFTLLLVAAVLRWGFPRRARDVLSVFSITAMTVAGILFFLDHEGVVSAYGAACVLAGAGVVWCAGSWMELYLRLRPGEAFFYALGSMAFGSLFGLGLGFLPEYASILVSVVMPTLSYVMLRQGSAVIEAGPPPVSGEGRLLGASWSADFDIVKLSSAYDVEPKSTWVLLALGLALFEFAVGVARGFPYGESVLLAPAFQVLHQLTIVALCAAAVAAVLAKGVRLRLAAIWRFQLVLVMAGILFSFSLDRYGMSLGATLVTIANSLLLPVLWYVCYDLDRNSSVHPCVPLGIGWSVFLLFREAGRWFVLMFPPDGAMVALLEILMILAVSVSIALVFSTRIPRTREFFSDLSPLVSVVGLSRKEEAATAASDRGGEGSGVDPSTASVHSEGAVDLVRVYGLTAREAEVVAFLVAGMSKAEIGKELFISENTVRGYVKNAYAKMDVHNKAQLKEKVLKGPSSR